MGDARHQGELVRKDTRHALNRSKAMLTAFHRACDADQPEAALRFLGALDQMMQTFPNNIERLELMGALLLAHGRFKDLTRAAALSSARQNTIH
jgi:hypothetical protein